MLTINCAGAHCKIFALHVTEIYLNLEMLPSKQHSSNETQLPVPCRSPEPRRLVAHPQAPRRTWWGKLTVAVGGQATMLLRSAYLCPSGQWARRAVDWPEQNEQSQRSSWKISLYLIVHNIFSSRKWQSKEIDNVPPGLRCGKGVVMIIWAFFLIFYRWNFNNCAYIRGRRVVSP